MHVTLLEIIYGKLIKAGATNLGRTSVLVVEATTLRNGVKEAIEMEYMKMYIEGDSTLVIQEKS